MLVFEWKTCQRDGMTTDEVKMSATGEDLFISAIGAVEMIDSTRDRPLFALHWSDQDELALKI